MKYTIVLALSFFTAVAHAALVAPKAHACTDTKACDLDFAAHTDLSCPKVSDRILRHIFFPNPKALKKDLKALKISPVEKIILLNSADTAKKLYIPVKNWRESADDCGRIVIGSLVCPVALNTALEAFRKPFPFHPFSRLGAIMLAYLGARELGRGFSGYSAKKNAEKMLDVIKILKKTKTYSAAQVITELDHNEELAQTRS